MRYLTDDDDKRWVWLASFLTVLLFASLVTLLVGAALGALSLSTIPQGWFILYATMLLTATVWLYGRDSFKQWKYGSQ